MWLGLLDWRIFVRPAWTAGSFSLSHGLFFENRVDIWTNLIILTLSKILPGQGGLSCYNVIKLSLLANQHSFQRRNITIGQIKDSGYLSLSQQKLIYREYLSKHYVIVFDAFEQKT
tara:strand:+ start:145 stop:492 length:348 start_codon:yes stop_codon:yes gene_type:complete